MTEQSEMSRRSSLRLQGKLAGLENDFFKLHAMASSLVNLTKEIREESGNEASVVTKGILQHATLMDLLKHWQTVKARVDVFALEMDKA